VYPFASAYLALLPLVARAQGGHGAELYGVLLAVVSVGAVMGSFAIDPLSRRFGPDLAVAIGTAGLAAALLLFGLARGPIVAGVASLVAGASWTIVLAILYVSAQVALPDWVRGRGLAVFLTVIFGSVTLGSLVWGQVAAFAGLSSAQFIAAGGALAIAPFTLRWKLRSAEDAAHGMSAPRPGHAPHREWEEAAREFK
jgi:MFS family permease